MIRLYRTAISRWHRITIASPIPLKNGARPQRHVNDFFTGLRQVASPAQENRMRAWEREALRFKVIPGWVGHLLVLAAFIAAAIAIFKLF